MSKLTIQKLKDLKDQYPQLTFNNDGYQYLPKDVRESHKLAIEEIESLLKTLIIGFVSFSNFKPRSNGDIVVRYQVIYDNDPNSGMCGFTGVAYTTFEELENWEA